MTTAQSSSQRIPRRPMSRETLQARAMQRASEERVHVFAVQGRPNCYIVKSHSNPAQRYYLVAGPGGAVGCSCKGFEYRQSCKHAEALKTRLGRESRSLQNGSGLEPQASEVLWN
jgi:hypothetical protein